MLQALFHSLCTGVDPHRNNGKDVEERYRHALNCMVYLLSDKIINSKVSVTY